MTDNNSKALIGKEPPGRLAWLVFRSLARFWAAIFLPYFRIWGENEFKKGNVIIARNFGLQTWVYAFRFFKKPIRIVLVDNEDNLKWFNIACNGGLEPIFLNGNNDEKVDSIKYLSEKGEIIFLIIPKNTSENTLSFIEKLDRVLSNNIRLFAIEGASEALPQGSFVPKFASICVFCGRPYFNRLPSEGLLDELNFLESTLYDLDIDEEPSFFRNNRRNQ
jgi:hypothetical protein